MKTSYRRRAILNRIHSALDAFYLLQRIDWEYDMRHTLDKILAIALEEIEFGEGRNLEKALLIIKGEDVGTLEVHAGWRVEDMDLRFSRTIVGQAIEEGTPILCENAKEDPRYHEAESLKELRTLSLICVPIRLVDRIIGALYIESHSPTNIFSEEDMEFLQEFTDAIAPYLKVALTHQDHVREIQKLRLEIEDRYGVENMIGRSEVMREVFELVRIAGSVDRTVLITGESGCGKELVAKAIHYLSPRKNGPLVVVDCSGLAEHLLESELFGHVKGAFTGASADKIGAFDEANGGTLFLDEISDAPKSLQQMLRRVIQESEIRRVGQAKFHTVDVRIICATNKSLPGLVEKNEFIRDLYYRINKLPIHIPPLRERREDIPPMIDHFLTLASRDDESRPSITVDAVEFLSRLDWEENNARELKNVVDLAVDFSSDKPISLDSIQRVLRIQQGEPLSPRGVKHLGGPDTGEGESRNSELVHIRRESFQGLLSRTRDKLIQNGDNSESRAQDRKATPFYVLQKETATRAVIEGLRVAGWKLRPAAKLLGISPMKLRGILRDSLVEALEECDGDLKAASQHLHLPADILEKKAADLGLEGIAT